MSSVRRSAFSPIGRALADGVAHFKNALSEANKPASFVGTLACSLLYIQRHETMLGAREMLAGKLRVVVNLREQIPQLANLCLKVTPGHVAGVAGLGPM